MKWIALTTLLLVGLGGCDNPNASRRPDASPAAVPAAVPAAAAPPRVVVLGLDAGDWSFLGPWMDQGLLPNLAKLRSDGVYGKLRSTEPSSSPVIWTSIATGKVPEKTGITWFVRFPHGVGKPVPVDRRQLKTSTLWDMFTQRRIDSAVLGWYVTWPAAEVNGRLLTDLAHFGRMQGSAWPAEFLWDLPQVTDQQAVDAMPRFMDFHYDPAKAVKREGEVPSLDYLVYDRFVRAWARDKFYLDAAERTLKDGALPETFFLYLRGTDDVQHGFWKFMEPDAFTPRNGPDGKPLSGTVAVPPEQVAAFGKVIQRYWQWIDEGVGRILAHYDAKSAKSPPLVIVCSDHGAGPAVGEDEVDAPEYLHLSGSHRIDGIFMASGPGIRSAAGQAAGSAGGGVQGTGGIEITGATIYDVAPTILHALGLPVGKDMDGRVLTDIFDEPLAKSPVETVESWDTGRAATGAEPEVPAAVDEKVLEHLKSLGYIGQ